MVEKLSIKFANKSDFESIYSLLNQLFRNSDNNRSKAKSFFFKNLNNQNYHIRVIKMGKEIVGFGTIAVFDNFQTCTKIALLDILVVDEQQRNKGYGKKLLSDLMNIAKKKKCTELHFSSTYKRKKAHKFYKKIGFQKTAYYFWKEL